MRRTAPAAVAWHGECSSVRQEVAVRMREVCGVRASPKEVSGGMAVPARNAGSAGLLMAAEVACQSARAKVAGRQACFFRRSPLFSDVILPFLLLFECRVRLHAELRLVSLMNGIWFAVFAREWLGYCRSASAEYTTCQLLRAYVCCRRRAIHGTAV